MTGNRDDELLMNELAMGRSSALDELIKRWDVRLRCFVERMCGSPRCVDDICQEVWTRLYLYRRRYDPTRPFSPFLFTIALNCTRTARRRDNSWSNQWDDSARKTNAGYAMPADGTDSLAGLIAAEQVTRLHTAIARLPDMQRAVVLLYLLCDTDYRRIADIIGRGEGTVRSHMHHALSALRSYLEKPSQPAVRLDTCEVDHD